MSDRGSGAVESVVRFAPKLNVRSEAGDPLDTAAQVILDMLHQAANAAEANHQQALEVRHKLSAQLRAAEDRIAELEGKLRHHQDRADRAERWLYQISVEIEQNFFGKDDNCPSQPPPAQTASRNQRR